MMIYNAANATEQEQREAEEELPFGEICRYLTGAKENNDLRIKLRELLEKHEEKLEKGDEKVKKFSFGERLAMQLIYLLDHGSIGPFNTPFSTNNAFFF